MPDLQNPPAPPKPRSKAQAKASRRNGKLGGSVAKPLNQAAIIQNLAADGYTLAEIAKTLKIHETTLWRRMKDDAGLRRACKKGQAQMTNRVEHALAHKAVGMVLPDSHVSNYQGVVTVTPLEKHLAPDTLAQIFYLKNRAPDRWNDRQQIEHQVTVAGLPEGVSDRIRALARGKNLRHAQVIEVRPTPEPRQIEQPPTARLWSDYE